MDPSDCSVFSPSGVFTLSVGRIYLSPSSIQTRIQRRVLCQKDKNLLSKQLEWNSMQNLVFDLVHKMATQFMICIPPWGALLGSVKWRTKTSDCSLKWLLSAWSWLVIILCFETNCDATPTSNEANTGEWSLVLMSVVQPTCGTKDHMKVFIKCNQKHNKIIFSLQSQQQKLAKVEFTLSFLLLYITKQIKKLN